MKRFVLISFILFSIILFAACGSQDSAVDSTPPEDAAGSETSENVTETKPVSSEPGTPDGDLKVTVTAPDGWEFRETAGIPINYSKDGASFMIKEEPYSGNTLDEVVEQAKGIFEGSFDNVQYIGGVQDLTVAGMDAKKFVFTCEVFDIGMKYQNVFFFVDRDVYVITCGSTEEAYDSCAADFERLIESVRLE